MALVPFHIAVKTGVIVLLEEAINDLSFSFSVQLDNGNKSASSQTITELLAFRHYLLNLPDEYDVDTLERLWMQALSNAGNLGYEDIVAFWKNLTQ